MRNVERPVYEECARGRVLRVRAMMGLLSASGPVRTMCLPAATVRCDEPVSPVWNQSVDLPLSATVPATGTTAGVENKTRHRAPVTHGDVMCPLTADS